MLFLHHVDSSFTKINDFAKLWHFAMIFALFSYGKNYEYIWEVVKNSKSFVHEKETNTKNLFGLQYTCSTLCTIPIL